MYDHRPTSRTNKHILRHTELSIAGVQPHGRGGVGALTGHPVGLIVIAAVILITMEYIPAAGWFFGASLAIGGVIGLALWLRHR